MRSRFLLPALLVMMAACSAPPADEPSEASPIEVTVADFMIDPAELEVTAGSASFVVRNDGPTPHNLSIRDAAGELVAATDDLSPGDGETIAVELEPGTYTIFCSLAGHESLGMSGTLTVTGP